MKYENNVRIKKEKKTKNEKRKKSKSETESSNEFSEMKWLRLLLCDE